MSDLISRSEYKSKLVKALDVLNKEYREALLNEDNDLILAIQNQQSAYMIALRLLDNEPIAYDIDKVVEELENNSFITVKQEEVQTKRKDIQSYIAVEKEVVLLKDAIEIVKQGGVSDDVCEWESKYINNEYVYSTSCDNIFIYETDSRNCPYCGKKIKVVE